MPPGLVIGLRAAGAVAAAELRRTLRDPHVVAYLIAPIALYPMLMWGALQLALYEEGRLERESVRIEVTGPAPLVAVFDEEPFEAATGGIEALTAGELDLVVAATADGDAWTVRVHHASTRSRSRRGLLEAEGRLATLRQDRLFDVAVAAGVPEAKLALYVLDSKPINGVEAFLVSVVAVLVGYIGAFAMLLSAIYPSIDLVVAEREKGTLETLLLAPVPRWSLYGGKALASSVLVLLAAVGNMASLSLTLAHLHALIGENLELTFDVDLLSVLLTVPTLVSTAAMVACFGLLVVLPARTFKEGEMIATTAIMVGFLPGVVAVVALVAGEANGLGALPFANLIVVLHAGLTGELGLGLAIGAPLENLAVAVLLVGIAATVASREDFLIGGRLPRWLNWMRRGEPT